MADDKLDKIKSSLKKGVTVLNVKTSTMLEKAKIKTHINTLEAEIIEVKKKIGSKVYQQWKNNGISLDCVENELNLLAQKEDEISTLQGTMDSLEERNKQILGSGNSVEEQDEDEGEQSPIVCPTCSTTYNSPKKFCRVCGTKLYGQ